MGERRSKIWLVVLLAIAFVGGWVFLYKDALFMDAPAFESALGQGVPETSVMDADGKIVPFRDFLRARFEANPETKHLLLSFWATWCGPCVKELPILQQNVKKYRNSGVEIVLINFDGAHREEIRDSVKKWLGEHAPQLETIYDPKDSLIQFLEISALPFNATVDRDLKWSYGAYGTLDFDAFEKKFISPPEN